MKKRKTHKEHSFCLGKCFLLGQETSELSKKKRALYWIYRGFVLVFSALVLTVDTLLLSVPSGSFDEFYSYFQKPVGVLLNFLPILSFLLLCYFICGKLWPAFLTTAIPFSAIAIGNYYKLRLRGDTAVFSDIKDVFLGLTIAIDGEYNLTPGIKIWFFLVVILIGIICLKIFSPGKIILKKRIKLIPIAIIPIIISILLCTNEKIYVSTYVTTGESWDETQYQIEHGVVYSFTNSIKDVVALRPKDYKAQEAKDMLFAYEEDEIPEDKKVNVIFIMREANNDISKLTETTGVDWSCFDYYKTLQAESYTGKLFTNIFAGGTVDTERSVLTGAYTLKKYHNASNSYVRYFKSQGYAVTGSHPSNDWFYNRKNINSTFGFDSYYFLENYFNKFSTSPWEITDSMLYKDLIEQFENRDKSKPYFNFSVTFEGHGPYHAEVINGESKVTMECSEYTKNVLSNYINIMDNTNKALKTFVDYFRDIEDPVVLCIFGDHNPWLGDNKSVYDELGINIDLTTQQGLRNYYQTEYIIWANDAAKKTLQKDFVGINEKPISPCFLMNVLFEQTGWKGPRYMKFMNEYMKTTPVLSSNSLYWADGNIVNLKSLESLSPLEKVTYYWNSNLLYE